MANDAKTRLSNFCLTNVRNLKVFLEVHGRDIAFAKPEQSYHLTSTDAEAAAVRLLLPLHRKRHIPESYSIVCIQLLSKIFIDSDFCHNYLHTLYVFACLL